MHEHSKIKVHFWSSSHKSKFLKVINVKNENKIFYYFQGDNTLLKIDSAKQSTYIFLMSE